MDDRELLLRLAAGPVSGDVLATAAGTTRAAAWKRVSALREAGIEIAASRAAGYTLAQPLDLLDRETVHAALPAAVQARIASLAIAWSIDSTNSELLRQATPAEGCAVLLAEQQTGGRGRRGRAWVSPLAAHLYLSVARQFGGGLARLGGLGLVAGIAAAEALVGLGFEDVGLKWPNDLVADGRKVGGLLVEGGGEHNGPVRAVIGLGLNVRMPAAQGAAIDQPWTDLATLRPGTSRSTVAAAVLAALVPALDTFDRAGLAAFVPRYAALDLLSGRMVDVATGTNTVSGRAVGIAADGALRVETDAGERQFHAGEVSVRRVGTHA